MKQVNPLLNGILEKKMEIKKAQGKRKNEPGTSFNSVYEITNLMWMEETLEISVLELKPKAIHVF